MIVKNKRFSLLYMSKERRSARFYFLEKDFSIRLFKLVDRATSTNIRHNEYDEKHKASRRGLTRERMLCMEASRSETILTMHATHFGGSSSVTFDEEYSRSFC